MSDEQSTRVHRVVPGVDPGITRVRTKTGFDYLGPDGKPVGKADRARCEALVLPPAWTEVWISLDPDGHIQAVGTTRPDASSTATTASGSSIART